MYSSALQQKRIMPYRLQSNINNSKCLPDDTQVRLSRFLMPVLCVMLALALLPVLSFRPEEVDLINGGLDNPAFNRNILGYMGTRVAWCFLLTFGLAAYPITALLLISAFRRLFWRRGLRPVSWEYLASFFLFAIGTSMLLGIWPNGLAQMTNSLNLNTLPGGVIGQRLSSPNGLMTRFMNWPGAAIVSSILIFVPLAIIWFFDWKDTFSKKKNETDENDNSPLSASPEDERTSMRQLPKSSLDDDDNDEINATTTGKRQLSTSKEQNSPQTTLTPNYTAGAPSGKYEYPSISLLDVRDNSSFIGANAREIERNKLILQKTLDDFNVEAEVVNAVSGPQVTLFEILPSPGVRLNRITSLEGNIKMTLAAESLRILAPIPGKNLVGIEVPNEHRAIVSVYSLMNDKAWTQAREQIPLLLGKNISGKTIIMDLTKTPHLLIAGTTGSGKSVCMNLLITSMLFKFSPEELRLIMVDPKVVEFQAYATLPHLVVPVINDVTKVALALRWAINEMERRYKIIAKAGVRDLLCFNKRPINKEAPPLLDDNGDPIPDKLPYIVIIIDELADIMATARTEVEQALSRIAAKSRAVGIHTIIATQRPDVKVITGTIKANYPVRIAFKVASQTDSQTIIGGKGAESLLGYGDMLLQPPGANSIERIQCGMASDEERNKVVAFTSAQAPQCFDESVLVTPDTENDDDSPAGHDDTKATTDEDSLINKAIEIILRDRRPTISYLQRALVIGYNKSASIMDELEKRGVVGPQVGTAPRQILITSPEQTNRQPTSDEGDI